MECESPTAQLKGEIDVVELLEAEAHACGSSANPLLRLRWSCGGRARGACQHRRLWNPVSACCSAAATPSASPTPLLGSARGALRNNGSDLVVGRVEALVTVRLPCTKVCSGGTRASRCRRDRRFVVAAKRIRKAVEVRSKTEPPIQLQTHFLRSCVDVAFDRSELTNDPT